MNQKSALVNVGRITGVFGIKGWLKVKSATEPEGNIVNYSPWFIKTAHGVKEVEIDDFQFRPQGLIVHIKGVDDRDAAELYTRSDVAVRLEQLPELDDEEFYWHQLIGLSVVDASDEHQVIGVVKTLMETGANDVLVVSPTPNSVDEQERLIPYVPGLYIKEIDLDAATIKVDWELDF